MPFSIAGPAYPALASLDGINRAADRISSGQKIDYQNNAAEAAVSGRLDSVIGETTISIRNATNQISALQKGDQTLGQISSQIERIQELAVQSGNGALAESDREIIEKQSQSLIEQASRDLADARFNGSPLFETAGLEIADLQNKLSDLSRSGDPSDQTSLKAISEDITSLRAEIGADQNVEASRIESLENERLITSNRQSRLSDTDLAEELTNLLQQELGFKAGVEVFNHRRLAEESIINLLTE